MSVIIEKKKLKTKKDLKEVVWDSNFKILTVGQNWKNI
jgi:hypothetical protein